MKSVSERKKQGLLAESKAISYLIDKDYQVFLPFEENGPIDLLAVKENKIYKISVKSTSCTSKSGSWIVELKTVSRRKDNHTKINKFDNSTIDKMLVYIVPLDKIVEIESLNIKSKSAYHINLESSEQGAQLDC